MLARLPAATSGNPRVLDIGPRFEVDLLHRLVPSARVDTLGLDEGLFEPLGGEQRVIFDLNEADDAAARPALGPYQLIIMAEVFEHLYMAPTVVLGWIATLLAPDGYLLIQTPNGVSLAKRLRMLIGIQPFNALTSDRAYPGHIREYSPAEMFREGRAVGLEVVYLGAGNYFDSEKLSNRLYQRFERLMPRSLPAGLTVVYRPSPSRVTWAA